MIGASRPAEKKEADNLIDPYLALKKYRRKSVCSNHALDISSTMGRSRSGASEFSPQDFGLTIEICCPEEAEVLRLNVGGDAYRLKMATIREGNSEGLLTEFVNRDHAGRLLMCDSYFSDTNEYFFERSALLFDQIYLFYITGVIHNPKHICSEVFIAELVFWNLYDINFAKCCWPQPKECPPAKTSLIEDDLFKSVPFGQFRRYIWNLIEVPESSNLARCVSLLSIIAVLLSNIGLVVQSIPELEVTEAKVVRISEAFNETEIIYVSNPHPFFGYLECICVIWFTFEYVSKMLSAVNRRSVFLEYMNIIDLVAILPFYIELTLHIIGMNTEQFQEVQGALLVVRIMRVLRVVRLFKLGRYSSGLRAFALTIQHSKEQLSMLLIVLLTGTMFFSTLVYFLEKDEPNTNFSSIPAAFWWCIVTMTTVGYGDFVPQTIGGKLVATGAIAAGILVLALPITIIVDNFMKVQEELNMISANSNPFRRSANPHNDEEDKDTVDNIAAHQKFGKEEKYANDEEKVNLNEHA